MRPRRQCSAAAAAGAPAPRGPALTAAPSLALAALIPAPICAGFSPSALPPRRRSAPAFLTPPPTPASCVARTRPAGAAALSASFLEGLFAPRPESDPSPESPLPVQTLRVELDNGTVAEVLTCSPPKKPRRWGDGSSKPPLLFIHGSFHAAWCWSERYMPHFASRGYPTAALSLRGTGGTFAGEGVTKVGIDEHADDLAAFVRWASASSSASEGEGGGWGLDVGSDAATKPVLIAHSFGGLAVMKYLERDSGAGCDSISGVCAVCSVPPSGNSPMTVRYLRRSLIDSWKITAGLAMKKVISDDGLCRELFFGGPKIEREDGSMEEDWGVTDEDVRRYRGYFSRDTAATIDLADLARKLPSERANGATGAAPYADRLPPALVIGAAADFIVDGEGVQETAQYFGLEGPMMVDSPHDVMLGGRWRNGADALEAWLDREVVR